MPLLEAEAGFVTTLSAKPYQAFWLVHNRGGRFDEESANAVGYLSARKRVRMDRMLDWGGGVTLLGRGADHSTFYFHEGWLEAGIGFLRLEAGRREQIIGHTASMLSSGSAGMSGNAAPITRIALYMPEFEPVPLTGGWLEFKGHFGHGWLDGERHIRDSWLHDKSFYLQTGGETGVKFYAGLLHFAEWAGVRPNGVPLPDSFADLLKVMAAKGGSEGAPGGDQVNALGAHYGVWDWGMRVDELLSAGLQLQLYYQHIFGDRSGLLYRNLRDGLFGIALRDPSAIGWITGGAWEFLYTKHQTGPGLPDPQVGDSPDFCAEVNCGYRFNGRDDYYNNYYYLDGWSHRSRAIGSPLFLTRTQLDRIDPAIQTYNDRYFVSTRIVAHHVGLEGRPWRDFSWRFLATWNRHYGTYWGLNLGQPWGSLDPNLDQEAYFFNPPLEQWYFMLEGQYRLPGVRGVQVHLALALDQGELFNNGGVMMGASWSLW